MFLNSVKWTQNKSSCFFLRFLLVGQTMPTLLDEDLTKDGIEALSSRPFRNVSRQTSRQMSLCGTPEKSSYRQLSVSDRSSIRVEEIIPAARVAIQVSDLCIQDILVPLIQNVLFWKRCYGDLKMIKTWILPSRNLWWFKKRSLGHK